MTAHIMSLPLADSVIAGIILMICDAFDRPHDNNTYDYDPRF